MKYGITLLALSLGMLTGYAQEPQNDTPAWSLQQCIDYANAHNISVQQQEVKVSQSQIELNTAQNSRLPDLNASFGANMSFGRSLISNNTYADNNQLSGNLGVSASLPVFMGGRINHQIAAGKLGFQAALKDLERIREDVAVNIMSLYLEVLFNKELVGVAQSQLDLSTLQVTRSREQVAAGKVAEATLYEAEALMAQDELSLTQNKNNLSLALLALSQALNRPSAEGFDVVYPVLDSAQIESSMMLRDPKEVVAYALDNRPHIQAERLRLDQAERSVRLARSSFYPQITLSGGYGTNVYDSFAKGAVNPPFGRQFRNNSSEYFGLTVSIPIFNRLATRNSVRTARLSVKNQLLTLTQAEQSLQKEVETAYYTAEAARQKYRSAQKALESARIAFQYETEKFAAGRSTTFDYSDAKNRMVKAESDLLQAKYELIFRTKILDYYAGYPLTL